MLPPKAFAGIGGLLLIVLFVTWLVIYDTYDENEGHELFGDDEKRIIEDIKHNYEQHPLTDIFFADICPQDSETFVLARYPGIAENCYCADKQGLDALTVGACQSNTNCKTYPAFGDKNQYQNLKKWIPNQYICGKRGEVTETDSQNNCPKGLKKCSTSYCVKDEVDVRCPIVALTIERRAQDYQPTGGFEKRQTIPGTTTNDNTDLILYLYRGGVDNNEDRFIKALNTGFAGYPCLDPLKKNERAGANKDLKIDYPENYKGCGVFGADSDSAETVHILYEDEFLRNNQVSYLVPPRYMELVDANDDQYQLVSRHDLLSKAKDEFCKDFDFDKAIESIQHTRREIIDRFDEAFLVFYIVAPISLILIIVTFATGESNVGKIMSVLVTISLLIIACWWMILAYEIDDLQEQDTELEKFRNADCITYNPYREFFSKANIRVQHILDYFDNEENAMLAAGYFVAIVSLLGFLTLAYRGRAGGSRGKLTESSAKDERYAMIAKDRQY